LAWSTFSRGTKKYTGEHLDEILLPRLENAVSVIVLRAVRKL